MADGSEIWGEVDASGDWPTYEQMNEVIELLKQIATLLNANTKDNDNRITHPGGELCKKI